MRSYALAVVGLVLLLWLVALAGSVSADGNTYTVNTTSYTDDGSCDPLASGDCTLWEAINAAASASLTDTVAFDIPVTDTNYGYNTTGVWTIVLTQTLPSAIQTIVDGTTQAANYGSDTNPYGPEIEISGEGTPSGQSCWTIGRGNTIKGLAINRCQQYGLLINTDDNALVGNYMGIDATGSFDVSPTSDMILLGNGAEDNTIGGPNEADRNVISGTGGGIRIFQTSASTSGNVIEGNYFGSDRTGTLPVPNGYGIKIEGGAHANTIGPNNVIAHNSGDGVLVDGASTDRNTITQNSIHSNGDLGIDLTNDGNGAILAPVISSHTCTSASGTAPAGSTVELFIGPDDEGKTYLTSVSADGAGNWSASGYITDEMYLTATATDASGNTSEFSAAVSGCGNLTYLPLANVNY
jgi:CSLREA domain-containing protein